VTVEVSTLKNGLRIISDSMDAVETVSVGVWVEVGTRHEHPDVNGISHLLEHMAFKGTKRRSALEIAEEIEAVGGHLNAYTSRENTAYYAKVLKEDLPLAIDVLADILQHATMDPKELTRERSVIVQEIMQTNDTPDDVIYDHFQVTAFPDQALGRPVLGEAERIQNLPRETIVDFMQKNYSAQRMIVAAAGKLDHDELVALAEKAFSALPEDDQLSYEPAQYAGGDFREKRDIEQAHIVLGFEGIPYESPEFYAASTFSNLFGGGMSSRLFQEIRERRGLAYSIYSFNSSYRDCGLMGIYAGTGAKEIEELLPVLCSEVCSLPNSLNEKEVTRARNQIKASLLMSLESTGARAEQLAQQMLIFGRPIPVDELVGRVEAVDTNTVASLAKRIFSGKPTMASIGPIKRLEPYAQTVSRLA